ncbi:MAG: hypothetical protein LBR60_03315 [Fibrobacter sp.]|jgi:hypothetical protein|nr:hypothetical protein [Fibrobacter sp.]
MINFYPNTFYYPRERVEEKFANGELQAMQKMLLDFVERHRENIWIVAQDENEPGVISDESLLDGLRSFLLYKGSLQPAFEMAELIKEIDKEAWYRNEIHPENPKEVADDWKEQYASQWREARMFETFFLIEVLSDKLVEMLRCK